MVPFFAFITFNEFNIATVWHAAYTINFKDEVCYFFFRYPILVAGKSVILPCSMHLKR